MYLDNSPYIKFEIYPDESNLQKLIVTFKDFGSFLKIIDISKDFIKGEGDLIIYVDNKVNKITHGNFNISDFSIKEASVLARILQLASFTGLLEILASEGIPFNKLLGSFNNTNGKILFDKTRFEGISLGASLQGEVDTNSKTIDIEGVLIPAYAINSIINKIPLVGEIVTGTKGEGLIGVNFKAKGEYEDPDISINPLSLLTPGILRNIFNMKDNGLEDKKNKESNSD